MKRIVVIVLVCVAIPLYVMDMRMIVSGFLGTKAASATAKTETVVCDTASLRNGNNHFVVKGRSPFVPHKEQPKRQTPQEKEKSKPAAAQPSAPVNPPKITISGIMWNEANPLAMIVMPDGSSLVVKAGQALPGGILVKTIQRNQIEVVLTNNSFWIKR